jgi:hypothetical protein
MTFTRFVLPRDQHSKNRVVTRAHEDSGTGPLRSLREPPGFFSRFTHHFYLNVKPN